MKVAMSNSELETLRWYQEMGVDEIISNTPINRLEQPTVKQDAPTQAVHQPTQTTNSNLPQQPPSQPQGLTSMPRKAATPPKEAIDHSSKLALKCESLEALKEAVTHFDQLSICKTATNVVFSDGNPNAKVMLIGEAPGADEDAQGIPFCGASGQLLDKMLSFIGLTREKNFYITNTIFWRPPGNRKPTPEELAICQPFVQKHIALIKPELIILIGATAVQGILNDKTGITKLRGEFKDYQNQFMDAPIKAIPIFHPSYLLRSPGQKKHAWHDLLTIQQYLRDNNIKLD